MTAADRERRRGRALYLWTMFLTISPCLAVMSLISEKGPLTLWLAGKIGMTWAVVSTAATLVCMVGLGCWLLWRWAEPKSRA